MFKYSFVILCYVAFVSKQSSAFDFNFCSSDALPTLIQCLLNLKAEKYGPNYTDRIFFKLFDQRIECSKEGDCTPAPWQVMDSEVRLVLKYYDCMEKIADLKQRLMNEPWPETKKLKAAEFDCRIQLAFNLRDDFKPYELPLLPELNQSFG